MSVEYIVRPIREEDIDALYELAEASGIGFTSLPANRKYLEKQIQLSLNSFATADIDGMGEYYLFVLEHLPTRSIVGTSAIAGHVGMHQPFYSYKVGKLTKQCESLNFRKSHQTLTITTDLEGATEMCTLFLLPEHRHKTNGQLLARSRYLFMAEHPERFADPIIAELRGVSDEEGYSPFWNAIGRHFYGVDFPRADYLTGKGEKQFITALMPEFRLYTCMLPKSAQAAIGEVHEQTRPARALIEKEGFTYANYIDLFDGGPTMKSQFKRIKTIKNAKKCVLSVGDGAGDLALIASDAMDFKACISAADITEDSCSVSQVVIESLGLNESDNVWACGLR